MSSENQIRVSVCVAKPARGCHSCRSALKTAVLAINMLVGSGGNIQIVRLPINHSSSTAIAARSPATVNRIARRPAPSENTQMIFNISLE
jgi:hypothetical protein